MRITARLLVVGLLAGSALAVSTGAIAQDPAPPAGVVTPGVSFAPTDQVIVKMRSDEMPDAAEFGRATGQSVTNVRSLSADTVVLKLPTTQSGAALRATVTALSKVPGVEWAEPDVRMSVSADLSANQWDLGHAGPSVYGIDLDAVTPPANPSAVTVAVVDTGYVTHADLAGQFVGGYDFVSDSRIANDGTGRDSDASDPGDWITSQERLTGFFAGCPVSSSSWHGTHVSGTIAALSNGDGVNGINPGATVLPVRVLGKCGGYTSDITDGVRWAAGLTVTGVGTNPNVAKVVNLSLGGGGACGSTWQTAIDAVTAVGTTVVVAAGNSNADAGTYSPASCNGVITVASTGQTGSQAYYSNYGASVEIAAPGGDKNADNGKTILSTLNSGTTSPVASPGGDTYVSYQGTSMAAPHVAGVASLMLAANPALTPADVVQIIRGNATAFPSGSTCTTGCGSGIVNAKEAVAAATGATPTPTTSTTVPLNAPGIFDKVGPRDGSVGLKRSVTLSWAPSAGATQYRVCLVNIKNGNCTTTFSSGPYSGTSVKFVGLTSKATYEWQVQAVNASGATTATGDPWSFRTS